MKLSMNIVFDEICELKKIDTMMSLIF